MLIRFTVENFRSFGQEAVFSMLPGAMKKHEDHIIYGRDKNSIDVLRLGLLYGANASGKSNLIKAMDFARTFILEGARPRQPILVEPFRLDEANLLRPSRFEFEFVVDNQAYAYGFLIDRRRVHEEWLFEINRQKEAPIFERKVDVDLTPNITINAHDTNRDFLGHVAQSTRYNQLFLTKAYEDAVKDFEPLFKWFELLTIISPSSRANGIEVFVRHNNEFRESLSTFITAMNTGIEDIRLLPHDSSDALSDPALSKIFHALKEDEYAYQVAKNGQRFYFGFDQNGKPEIFSMGTIHKDGESQEVEFDMMDESDGTQRLIDLFPLFSSNTHQVSVIDELERSLHPNLVRRLLRWYLDDPVPRQLIVTTHESTLLDLEMLRRDEIWFVEKDKKGNSSIYSLEEFRTRADLDIRKGYLNGRFGAIPLLGHSLDIIKAKPYAA